MVIVQDELPVFVDVGNLEREFQYIVSAEVRLTGLVLVISDSHPARIRCPAVLVEGPGAGELHFPIEPIGLEIWSEIRFVKQRIFIQIGYGYVGDGYALPRVFNDIEDHAIGHVEFGVCILSHFDRNVDVVIIVAVGSVERTLAVTD